MVWPRMSMLERQITQVVLIGLGCAVAVGAVVGVTIDRIVHR